MREVEVEVAAAFYRGYAGRLAAALKAGLLRSAFLSLLWDRSLVLNMAIWGSSMVQVRIRVPNPVSEQ